MRVILLSLMIVFLFGYHANACSIVDIDIGSLVDPRNFCQGFAEIRSEFNGTETVHGRINKQHTTYNWKKAVPWMWNLIMMKILEDMDMIMLEKPSD